MVSRIGAHRPRAHGRVPVPPISCLVSFAKEKIALAPNNPSAWNYLRGILDHARVPYSTQAPFVRQYIVDTVEPRGSDILDLENPPPSEGAELPCSAAIEFMADVHEASGKDGISKAVEVGNPNVGNEHQCY
jgi:protein farnesyltransferase/geranylgeranyltransferase type-1 subunit alpha